MSWSSPKRWSKESGQKCHSSRTNCFSKFSQNVSRARRQTFIGKVWVSALRVQPRWAELWSSITNHSLTEPEPQRPDQGKCLESNPCRQHKAENRVGVRGWELRPGQCQAGKWIFSNNNCLTWLNWVKWQANEVWWIKLTSKTRTSFSLWNQKEQPVSCPDAFMACATEQILLTFPVGTVCL